MTGPIDVWEFWRLRVMALGKHVTSVRNIFFFFFLLLLFFFFFFFSSICPSASVCLSVYLSVCLPVCLPAWLPLSLSVSLCLCLSLSLSVSVSVSVSLSLSLSLSLSQPLSPSPSALSPSPSGFVINYSPSVFVPLYLCPCTNEQERKNGRTLCDNAHELQDVVVVKSGHDLHFTFKVFTDLVGHVLLQHFDRHQLLTVRLRAVQFS